MGTRWDKSAPHDCDKNENVTKKPVCHNILPHLESDFYESSLMGVFLLLSRSIMIADRISEIGNISTKAISMISPTNFNCPV